MFQNESRLFGSKDLHDIMEDLLKDSSLIKILDGRFLFQFFLTSIIIIHDDKTYAL